MLTISTHNLNREFGSYPAVKEIDLELAHGEALRFFTLMGTSKTNAMPSILVAMQSREQRISIISSRYFLTKTYLDNKNVSFSIILIN